jgi:tRNA nucleotidyltransferase (CCA-adding enzyme)
MASQKKIDSDSSNAPSADSPHPPDLKLLPDRVLVVLHEIGRLADEAGVSAYVVGGLVRDLLLRRVNLDLDIAVEGDGPAFARVLADRYRAGLKVFERFATALLLFPDGFKVDVATARRESYARPTALPVVAPATITEDLYRRDFTINAMAIQLNQRSFGLLVDCYGGWRDLHNRTVRVLHANSFADDPTRVFRAIRFEQRFGFQIERETSRLLKLAASSDLIDQLSGPRLRNEIFLLLGETNPSRALARMAELKLLRFLHPRLRLTASGKVLLENVKKALGWWRRRFPMLKLDRSVLYVAALAGWLSETGTDAVVRRLVLPNHQAGTVCVLRGGVGTVMRRFSKLPSVKPSDVYHLLAGLPDEGLVLLVAKSAQLMNASQQKAVKRAVIAHCTSYRETKVSLTGSDLKAMGLRPGPLFKKILSRLMEGRLNGEIHTEAEERDLVRRLTE